MYTILLNTRIDTIQIMKAANDLLLMDDFKTFNTLEIKYYEYLWFPNEWFKYLSKMEKLEKKGVYVEVDITYKHDDNHYKIVLH